ncbi:hypothetical protein V8G54_010716 [Vigna mungo]|uniref:Uncharacterized protein n=1 Tax=Vigna mungo TaxID=3915 RepID=A0AAQ3S6Q1_VIGMU
MPLHLCHDYALLSYAVMSQEREKGRIVLLQVSNEVSAVLLDLHGSFRDEGAMTERLRRFRVRHNTRDLGFLLVVVLDWLERTRCASSGTMRFGLELLTFSGFV